MSDTQTRLLDAAESRIRTGGFHAVSFRDLAAELGIKSASVHYHFPRKEDLGVAVIDRYAVRIMKALEEAAPTDAGTALDALIQVYREALRTDDKPCLCGVLGAEVQGLPAPLARAVRAFLGANIDWLTDHLRRDGVAGAEGRATMAVAALQGALMLAVTLGDHGAFEATARHLTPSELGG